MSELRVQRHYRLMICNILMRYHFQYSRKLFYLQMINRSPLITNPRSPKHFNLQNPACLIVKRKFRTICMLSPNIVIAVRTTDWAYEVLPPCYFHGRVTGWIPLMSTNDRTHFRLGFRRVEWFSTIVLIKGDGC